MPRSSQSTNHKEATSAASMESFIVSRMKSATSRFSFVIDERSVERGRSSDAWFLVWKSLMKVSASAIGGVPGVRDPIVKQGGEGDDGKTEHRMLHRHRPG